MSLGESSRGYCGIGLAQKFGERQNNRRMIEEAWMVELLSRAFGRTDLLVVRREKVLVEVMSPTPEDVYLYKRAHVAVASTI